MVQLPFLQQSSGAPALASPGCSTALGSPERTPLAGSLGVGGEARQAAGAHGRHVVVRRWHLAHAAGARHAAPVLEATAATAAATPRLREGRLRPPTET